MLASLAFAGSAACAGDDANGPGAVYEEGEELSGGATTVFETGQSAFSLAARNLKGARRDAFFIGNALFNRTWVTAPASTNGLDGLGPTFNASACSACHFKDGRGAPPDEPGAEFLGLLLRLSIPGTDAHGGPLDEPIYGGQFNHRAILGVPSEGRATVTYTEIDGAYADGTPYRLRQPTYQLDELGFGAIDPTVMVSPRTAPVMAGLGLLETVAAADLLALADPDDRDGDGISGRANEVWDPKAQQVTLGRFGWKANQPGLEQQNAGAFVGDMGITSPLFAAENCPPGQAACVAAVSGGMPEVDQEKLDEITFYSRMLAVPGRRDVQDPEVLRGKALFRDAGCADCHVPALTTGSRDDLPELANQAIRPYTDMLLHDMGDALADGRPDFLATGSEWRTPPLWGIGLVGVVNGHTKLLHDGRARDLAEAVLWHGGEGEPAREAFRAMTAEERAALLRFVGSL
jgi:CxxC motif-containing protein (DUF1111 family)